MTETGWGTVPLELFDLHATLNCGQVFHWQKEGDGWLGLVGAEPLYVEQQGQALRVPAGQVTLAQQYFALDHPLAEIHGTFPQEAGMAAALAHSPGLRIIRQPLWECLATFITSSMKQVAHIAQISHLLRQRYGVPVVWGGRVLHAYPTPAAMAAAGEPALRACGLGYRAKNLHGAAVMIASGAVDLEAVRKLPTPLALAELTRLPGVGVKVANCALLFAYERLEAFPIDVWIERVLRETFLVGKRKLTPEKLRAFAEKHFGPYGGYAQQYLFHHARATKVRGGKRQIGLKAGKRKKSARRADATSASVAP